MSLISGEYIRPTIPSLLIELRLTNNTNSNLIVKKVIRREYELHTNLSQAHLVCFDCIIIH